jgi:polyhydroxyalkanoate synthesis regulator phasin
MTLDFGILSLLLAAATFLIGRFAAAKQGGQADGELKSDIKHIKTSVEKQETKLDKVVGNYDEIRVEMQELKGRLAALEQKVEILHGGV